MNVESYVLDIMDGKRPGRPLLEGLSLLYRTGVRLRNMAYDYNLVHAIKARAPVISIGNIVAGGTGKTPLVRLLASQLAEHVKVAILSRGYRSEIEKTGEVVQLAPQEKVERCGDEPFWLASKLPMASIWVGKNRCLSAEFAVEAGAQVIILDDGMQYRRLLRDVEIVVMDGDDLFGRGYYLPRGLLRDSPARLKKADLIVVGGAKNHHAVREEIKKYSTAPILFVQMKLKADLQNRRVGIFCAIGKPEKFMQSVRGCGAQVVATYFKCDHDQFTPEELEAFAKRSGADLLICTEKDQVKIPQDFKAQLPLMPLEGELEITSGQDHWEKMKKKVLDGIQSHPS